MDKGILLPMCFSIGEIIQKAQHITATIGKALPEKSGMSINDITITEDEIGIVLVILGQLDSDMRSQLLAYINENEVPHFTDDDGSFSIELKLPDGASEALQNTINNRIEDYYVNGLVGRFLALKNLDSASMFLQTAQNNLDAVRTSVNLSQNKNRRLRYNWI